MTNRIVGGTENMNTTRIQALLTQVIEQHTQLHMKNIPHTKADISLLTKGLDATIDERLVVAFLLGAKWQEIEFAAFLGSFSRKFGKPKSELKRLQ